MSFSDVERALATPSAALGYDGGMGMIQVPRRCEAHEL